MILRQGLLGIGVVYFKQNHNFNGDNSSQKQFKITIYELQFRVSTADLLQVIE